MADTTLSLQAEDNAMAKEALHSMTLEEVNAIAASVLSYISHYRNEAALLEEVGQDYAAKGYAEPGPTRMTSIAACIPAFVDASGQSTGTCPAHTLSCNHDHCNARNDNLPLQPASLLSLMQAVTAQVVLLLNCSH